MSVIPDGTYSIELPFGNGAITDPGEGRFLNILPQGSLGPDAHKVSWLIWSTGAIIIVLALQIKIAYKSDKGGYALQFVKSGKYLTWNDEPSMNNKLVTGDKPRYFRITPHDYERDKYT